MNALLSFFSRPRQRTESVGWGLGPLLVVVLGIASLSISACSSDQTYLPALLADPMASYEAAGIDLDSSLEIAQSKGLLGSGPIQAEVSRGYAIDDQTRSEQVLDKAVAFAEANGWEMTQPQADNPHFFLGTKELVPGTAELNIWLGAVDPLSGETDPLQLNLFMEFDPVPDE